MRPAGFVQGKSPLDAQGHDGADRHVHSVCLGCNARCGIRFHLNGDSIVSVTGNPYHPYNTLSKPLDPDTPVSASLGSSGSLCGKALEVSGYVHNRFRMLGPLKRDGRRGQGRFKPIGWDQLIREIAFGGRLFEHVGEDRHVPGLNDLLSDEPIRADAPELGPKRNGFCFLTGRLQTGRKEFIDRFVKGAFGSVNRIGHTDICGIGFRMGNFAFTEGRQVELKADVWNARFVLVFGANVYEALQPAYNTYGAVLARRHAAGEIKFVIVDPRAQKASCHAEQWVPIRPGQDGAFAMGIIRWMIDNDAYHSKYLQAPNERAASLLGNGGYVNATHLVIVEAEDRHGRGADADTGRFFRAGDVGIAGSDPMAYVVADSDGRGLVSHHDAMQAELLVDREITLSDGRRARVKSAFAIMKEAVEARTVREYAGLAGVPAQVIADVAREFSMHAPRSCVCQYHGAGNYVGGVYAAWAVAVLNAMVGSLETKGGYCSCGGGAGSWKKGFYDMTGFVGRRRPSGVKISREKAVYEDSSLFRQKLRQGVPPYPAERPWFPFTKGGLCVEALSGIDQAYPYPVSALFLYFFNPVYSIPGGFRFRQTLQDTEKVPLLVSIDVGINESNIYADYIVPDVTYAEGQYGWLSPHAPCMRFTGIRTPAVEPITEKTRDGRPICMEILLIDLAETLKLPGFGKGAIPDRHGKTHVLHRAEDFYLRAFSNVAENAGLEQAGREDLEFVEKNYPVSRYKSVLSEDQWNRIAGMLARGGIFLPVEDGFDDNRFIHGVKRFVLYNERLAHTTCSVTGRRFSGTLMYTAPPDISKSDFPFTLVSYKNALHTQSRTVWDRIAMELHPENYVMMNRRDADRLGLEHQDEVLVTSPDNPQGLKGRLHVTDTVRPGVVAISISYGHTQLGASRVEIAGNSSYAHPDQRFAQGINPNEMASLDPRFGNTPVVDLLGGIPDFSSSRVMVQRA